MRRTSLSMFTASSLAASVFILYRNLPDATISWLLAFVLWLATLGVLGYLGNTAYNSLTPRQLTVRQRYLSLWLIIVFIFVATYLVSQLTFTLLG
jgi:hypothetical protein